ncbi:hypothetical protein BN1708_020235, partial [Verticillium longisporum]
PRRQPQLAHAARAQVQHRHAGPRHGHVPRGPLRHEPRKLHRGHQLGHGRRDGRVRPLLAHRVLVRPHQAAQGPARQDDVRRARRRRPRRQPRVAAALV